MMILDLHRQGLSPTAIARQLGIDRKTVRKYIARGMDPPNYRAQPGGRGAPTTSCRICGSV
jgi:transposase